MIYEPKEDSFLLQKYVKRYANGKVLDVGTGSGIQAITALEKTKDVLATDINKESIKHVKQKGVKGIESNLFDKIKERFDLIIFNPPYLPRDEREDKISAYSTTGGRKGYELLIKFISNLKNHLKKDGKALIVFSNLTNKDKIDSIIKKNNLNHKCLETKKIDFEELYVYLIW